MIIDLVIGSVLGIGGAILAAHIWETRIRDRVSVRRIVSAGDPDTEALLGLYQKLFPDDGTNYASDEMLDLLDGAPEFSDDRHVQAENILLAAKYRGNVIGFLLCHFYPKRRKAIVSYYGINKEVLEARCLAATKLLPRLKRILLDGQHPCDFLFFDLQGVDPTTSKKEASYRKARPRLFKRDANRLKFTAYLLQFPYACPKVALRPDTCEYPHTLMCVPVSARLPRPVPRSLVLEFLNFFFLDCYGDIYPVSDERFQPYHDYLQQRLKHYEDTLPPEVQAV